MVYTPKNFIDDLAIFTAGGLIGKARMGKFVAYAARTGVSLIGLGARQGIAPVLATPLGMAGAGAALGYGALQTEPGQQLLAAAEERGRQDRIRFERAIQDTLALARDPGVRKARRKKRMTKFNRSVKEGMAVIKKSTSYGKKGVINAPKRAFTAVTKLVSKVRQGKKTPKKGPMSEVARKARQIMGA